MRRSLLVTCREGVRPSPLSVPRRPLRLAGAPATAPRPRSARRGSTTAFDWSSAHGDWHTAPPVRRHRAPRRSHARSCRGRAAEAGHRRAPRQTPLADPPPPRRVQGRRPRPTPRPLRRALRPAMRMPHRRRRSASREPPQVPTGSCPPLADRGATRRGPQVPPEGRTRPAGHAFVRRNASAVLEERCGRSPLKHKNTHTLAMLRRGVAYRASFWAK